MGRGRTNLWSREEVEFLRKNWINNTIQELSNQLDRTVLAIQCKAALLKLGKRPYKPGRKSSNSILERKVRRMKCLIAFCEASRSKPAIDKAKEELKKLSGLK